MKVKDTILRWLIPFILLFAAMMGLLIRFQVVTYQAETDEVEENLLRVTGDYARQIDNVIGNMKVASATIASVMEHHCFDSREAGRLLTSLAISTEAYMTVLCDKTGEGKVVFQESGDTHLVDLESMSYFGALIASEDLSQFVEEDEILGKRALVFATPIFKDNETAGYLLQYYDTSNFKQFIKKVEFDLEASYYLITAGGVKIAWAGKAEQGIYSGGDNLWDNLRENAQEPARTLDKVDYLMANKKRGVAYFQVEGKDQVIVYSPVDTSDWNMAICLNRTYVDTEVDRRWEAVSKMMWQMLFMIFVFLGVILAVNIFLKLKGDEKRKQLKDKADTDLLTDLHNKVTTERRIKEYIAKNPSSPALMFLLDIDNFKGINDTMGHAFGDEVLRTLGYRLRAQFRTSDIVGRIGGDEFMIFLCNITDDAAVAREGVKMSHFFRNFQVGGYVKYLTTASVGAVRFPQDAQDFESLYKAADQALYTAKKRGKNQVVFFKEEQ